jgi:hypothetical protein
VSREFAWDPWMLLRSIPHITYGTTANLPVGERARFYPESDVILLADHLSQAERRVSMTHELVHRGRGHRSCATPGLERKQERACERETARLLIPLNHLIDAMLWGCCIAEWAEQLWVDEPTVQTRLDHLHPAERGYLKRRIEMKEHTA